MTIQTYTAILFFFNSISGNIDIKIPTALKVQENNLLLPSSSSKNLALPCPSVPDIAREITVRILTSQGGGSGVIIARQGDRYTVLTNHHVVIDSRENQYTVITTDGLEHPAEWLQPTEYSDLDLALVQFTTSNIYRVAEIGNSKNLSVNDIIYATGFPSWNRTSPNDIENTRDWGLRAYRFTEGTVGMILPKSLQRGYQLGYSNSLANGMSGGPVLDRDGRLVGINGKSKYPLAGIRAFTFIDGTKPSVELFQQMQTLSWGIPITTIQRSLFPKKFNPVQE
ncbi:serine protease [Okeania sp.]|uniref:S1 family peptidase n=1 Tax=Okeania sp. TaxID=3100323 RepID=UPI002B4B2AAF|nr:serine protease [Okeania sp.]MEB3343673.1 serine protease [Okeania sp.]